MTMRNHQESLTERLLDSVYVPISHELLAIERDLRTESNPLHLLERKCQLHEKAMLQLYELARRQIPIDVEMNKQGGLA